MDEGAGAGILDESLFGRLTHLFSNVLLVVWEVGPLNCKRNKQNWYEFNWSCLAHVKSPSQVGSKQYQIGTKCVILTLSHNTIDIALVRTDGWRVWLVAWGHVVTILSMGTRVRENGRCQRRSVAVNKDLWRRSGRSCYEWQADLSGRCWVRLDCNGGFKGWCTTLNQWPFCVIMSAPPWFVWWFTQRAFGDGKLSKLFIFCAWNIRYLQLDICYER